MQEKPSTKPPENLETDLSEKPQERVCVRYMPNREKLEWVRKKYPEFKVQYVEALQALFELTGNLDKALDQMHLKNGFSRARYLFLMVLLHEEGNRLTPNEIANRLNVTRGNMTGIIDTLFKEGYVNKYEDEADRRKVWIEMTPAAHEFLKQMMPDYFKRLEKFMSVITPEEVDALVSISRKLSASVGVLTE